WKKIIWRFKNDTFNYAPVEAYFSDFFNPGLLTQIFENHTPPQSVSRAIADLDRRRPLVTIERLNGQQERTREFAALQERFVTIQVAVTENTETPERPSYPAGSGARDVRIFRNGSLVKRWSGDMFALGERYGCQQEQQPQQQNRRRVICSTT